MKVEYDFTLYVGGEPYRIDMHQTTEVCLPSIIGTSKDGDGWDFPEFPPLQFSMKLKRFGMKMPLDAKLSRRSRRRWRGKGYERGFRDLFEAWSQEC